MTFAQRRNRLTTHFSERITVVKRRMTVHQNLKALPLFTWYFQTSFVQGCWWLGSNRWALKGKVVWGMNGDRTTFHLSRAYSFYRPSVLNAAHCVVNVIHTIFWLLTDRSRVITYKHLPRFHSKNPQHFALQRHKWKRCGEAVIVAWRSVSQPLWDRGPVDSFFIRRGPGPNRFTRKYLSSFF